MLGQLTAQSYFMCQAPSKPSVKRRPLTDGLDRTPHELNFTMH